MRLRLVDQLVLRELLGSFALGTGLFTALFVSAETVMGVGRLLLEAGGGTALLGTYLVNRLPQILVLTLPMATLLSTLLAFGRLSSQRELAALRVAGYGFLRVALPALGFGAAVAAASLALNEGLVPPTMARANALLLQTARTAPGVRGLVAGPRVLASGEVLVAGAESLDPGQGEMRGLFVHVFFEGRRRREIYADRARWTGQGWVLSGMRWVEFGATGELGVEMRAARAWTPLPVLDALGEPASLARGEPSPDEEGAARLFQRARGLRAGPGGAEAARRAARLEILAHQKVALPLACLVFAGVGVPLGVQPYRTGLSTGFGLSLVFILVYYALMTTGLLLGEQAALRPALAAWLPNGFFLVVGAWLLRARERA